MLSLCCAAPVWQQPLFPNTKRAAAPHTSLKFLYRLGLSSLEHARATGGTKPLLPTQVSSLTCPNSPPVLPRIHLHSSEALNSIRCLRNCGVHLQHHCWGDSRGVWKEGTPGVLVCLSCTGDHLSLLDRRAAGTNWSTWRAGRG